MIRYKRFPKQKSSTTLFKKQLFTQPHSIQSTLQQYSPIKLLCAPFKYHKSAGIHHFSLLLMLEFWHKYCVCIIWERSKDAQESYSSAITVYCTLLLPFVGASSVYVFRHLRGFWPKGDFAGRSPVGARSAPLSIPPNAPVKNLQFFHNNLKQFNSGTLLTWSRQTKVC